jgi:arsenical pump membrane protein
MAGPYLAVVAIEYMVFVRFFRFRLRFQPRPGPGVHAERPTAALAMLGLTVIGLLGGSAAGVNSAWIAFGGAAGLAVMSVTKTRPADRGRLLLRTLRATNPLFLAFVLGLDIVVSGVRTSRLGDLLADVIPRDPGFVGLLLVALLAAVLANLVNNLPAALLLAPLVGPVPGATLAVLLGVNIGPNLSYTGSLATLLWRQLLHDDDHPPDLRDFLLLGMITVPITLVASVVVLWVGLSISGVS